MGKIQEEYESETELSRLCAKARMGFKVIPFGMMHVTLGMGLIYMDGDGFRFVPFDTTKEPMAVSWIEFDKKVEENKNGND